MSIEQIAVGTPVRYWKGVREGLGKISRTRTTVQDFHGTPVVWVEGEGGFIAMTHIQPVGPADELRDAASRLRCQHSFSIFSVNNPRPTCHTCGIRYTRWREMVSDELTGPLAVVLDQAAEMYESTLSECLPELLPRIEPNLRATVEAELAVARVINGGPPTVWSDAVPPGGQVCAVFAPGRPDDICGTPVESEPCPDHGSAL